MPAVKDAHTLCVTFQLPPLLKAYRKKADEYLSHLIGHEGRGSLFSLLKARTLRLLDMYQQPTSLWMSAHSHQPNHAVIKSYARHQHPSRRSADVSS